MSALQQVDDLIAWHRERTRQLDAQLADAKQQHSALIAERDAFMESKSMQLVTNQAMLSNLQDRLYALTTNPFPKSKPLADFDDWRSWARHHVPELALQDLNLDDTQCLLLLLDVKTNVNNDQTPATSIIIAFDANDQAAGLLAKSTSALGVVVVTPSMQGIKAEPYGVRCAPTHLVMAIVTLCADAPSTMVSVFGADMIRSLMTELKEAERTVAASVGIAL